MPTPAPYSPSSAPFTLSSTASRVPVLISVPHSGTLYSPALLAAARLPVSALEVLEDPLVDRLIGRGVEAGAAAIVAHAPRAEIDLNRSLDDLDPAMMVASLVCGPVSRRANAGLGLIPSRLTLRGAIWRRSLTQADVDRRVSTIYEPYHAAIGATLARMRERFGVAVLLDCHSMPPLGRPGIVLGDRYGTSSGEALVRAAEAACAAHGACTVRNDPYAGGEIVARHGRPGVGIHALQIEVDRTLYLQSDLRKAGPGFDRVTLLIAAIVTAVSDASLPSPVALAAE